MPVCIVKSNIKRVYGLSFIQKNELKARLTFSNPKYLSACQWSKWGPPKRIPEYLTYYEEGDGYLEVPLHFELPFASTVIADFRTTNYVVWPKLAVNLRPGQKVAFDAYLRNPENGQVVLDTGEGKTILAYAIAAKLQQKALILVDRNSYAKSWFDDIEVAFGGVIRKHEVGLIKGDKFILGKYVTVAFVQTLNNRDLSELSKHFGIIIHDESDTAAAPTRFNVVQQFKAKYRLAISGTIKRTDGLEFLHSYLYGGFSVNLQGQGQNILTGNHVEIRRIETGFNCKVPKRFNRFISSYNVQGENEESVSIIDYNKLWKMEAKDAKTNKFKLYYVDGALKQGESCLILTHRVFHAILLGIQLKSMGHKFRILYGSTPDELKDKFVDEARKGEIKCIISTFHYIKRGANIPRLSRAFAVTQTANETELRQAIGRIRRTFSEAQLVKTKSGSKIIRYDKDKCVWYDFTCNNIAPYRFQASKRLQLWTKMGFKVVSMKG